MNVRVQTSRPPLFYNKIRFHKKPYSNRCETESLCVHLPLQVQQWHFNGNLCFWWEYVLYNTYNFLEVTHKLFWNSSITELISVTHFSEIGIFGYFCSWSCMLGKLYKVLLKSLRIRRPFFNSRVLGLSVTTGSTSYHVRSLKFRLPCRKRHYVSLQMLLNRIQRSTCIRRNRLYSVSICAYARASLTVP